MSLTAPELQSLADEFAHRIATAPLTASSEISIVVHGEWEDTGEPAPPVRHDITPAVWVRPIGATTREQLVEMAMQTMRQSATQTMRVGMRIALEFGVWPVPGRTAEGIPDRAIVPDRIELEVT